MHDEAIYAERVLSAGANGYIMKQADAEELLLALRRVLGGGIYVSEAIGNSMIRKLAAGGRYVASNPIERLSNRELQILQLIGSGLSTRQAAQALELSMKTIETHRERIKRKLHLATGSQLVQYAVNWSEKVGRGRRLSSRVKASGAATRRAAQGPIRTTSAGGRRLRHSHTTVVPPCSPATRAQAPADGSSALSHAVNAKALGRRWPDRIRRRRRPLPGARA